MRLKVNLILKSKVKSRSPKSLLRMIEAVASRLGYRVEMMDCRTEDDEPIWF